MELGFGARIWIRITIRAGSCKLGVKREVHSIGKSTITGVAAASHQGGESAGQQQCSGPMGQNEGTVQVPEGREPRSFPGILSGKWEEEKETSQSDP